MSSQHSTVLFGGGCFWCTEAVFKMVKGVISVTSGYAGGTVSNPTYEQVSSGKTGHVEVIKVEYNPTDVSFRSLLLVFFGSHDPTTLNQQGHDVGTQYRSAIFCESKEQIDEARSMIGLINASNTQGAPVVTEVVLLETSGPSAFYPAETYHQNYYESNPQNRYCAVVINPKLEKVQKELAEFLK